MDLTVLNVAVPDIRAELLPDNATMLWIVDVYSLTVAALLVTSGALGDRVGRKRVALSGLLVFGCASAAAGFAGSAAALITSRFFLGVGTALMMASTVAIIRSVFSDDHERAFAIGIWTAAHSVGATLGPVIGGLVLEHSHWGAVFLINVPVVAVVFMVGLRIIPESRDSDPQPWDMIGVVLSIVGIAAVAFSIKKIAESFDAAATASPVGVVGIALMVAFVVRQLSRPRPLLDLRLFGSARFTIAVVAVLSCFGSYVALLFFLAQWFQYSHGYSTLVTGLAMVPLAIANAVGAIGGPAAANGMGMRVALCAALGAFAMGAAGLAALSGISVYWPVAILLVVCGAGAGVIMTLGADAIMSTVTPDKAGQAGAIQETTFELSAGLGVALFGTISAVVYSMTFSVSDGVDRTVVHEADRSVADAMSAAHRLRPDLGEVIRAGAVSAFNSGFSAVTIAMSALLAATAVLTAIVIRPRRV